MNLYCEAGKLQEQGIAFAIATILTVKGSTPRNTAKMIVKSDGSIFGTIGGGLIEAYVIAEAVTAIRENQSKTVEYTLDSEASGGIQMLCGGAITVLIEVVAPQPRIIMIGGGHVGLAVAKLADFLGYRLVVIDDRQEFANAERYPMASEISRDPDIAKAIERITIDNNSYIVIATKDVDYQALEQVIESRAAYIGMIGSRRKGALIKEELKAKGISAEKIQSVFTPVGLDIGAETPEEIAVSILGEIIKVRNSKTGRSMRDIH
jgi:xanthine dehydrogenase accessory factor